MRNGARIVAAIVAVTAVLLFIFRGIAPQLLDDAANGIRAFRDRL